ncbi:Xylose isomerase domain protein TIM barrel [Methanococcus aeolicus Nankai-3]|uniref:Xylose isomerase domain protein TIM barrel n=1 Tax=Methanococcus aeolicus (strain ATCC BAA-1280 / DSM 17508 / OCM 812 / Nankai-3) TaxID=419665 RepID=A6UT92_META3|nr:sugar phosphate isomerase/epimerase family protein [Methanococcus aeolicus]ABR55714.1 Xylose isomerase domain protein TIM barrel [Methanococcus aeolicus Nankai-3]
MKIGISSSVFLDSNANLKDTLDFLEKKVNFVELVCDGNINIMEQKNIDISYNYDLNYTIHCPLTDISLSSYREKVRKFSISYVKDIIKVANKVDAKLIVLHPGHNIFKYDYDKSLNSLIKSLNDLNMLQNEYGIKITIENMPSYDMFMFRSPIEEIISNLGDLGITFDVGHSFLNNNIEEFLDKNIVDKISHIHIHDNNSEYDEHLCIGDGKIDFKKYQNKLSGINCITMIELQNKNIEHIDKCISNLKKLYDL